MIIPIRTDSPLRSTPWMNWALILANVVVFGVERMRPAWSVRYMLSPQDPHLMNFLTYAFLHANALHLGSNMLFLYIFGNNVNDKTGNVGYLGLYLAGAVFAGIGYVLTSSGSDAGPVVGASGAVSAVTGAYLVLFPRSNITIFYWLLLFFGWTELPSLYFIAFFFVQDVFLNFTQDSGVAHMAHISGSLFGAAVCFGLLALHLLPRDQFDVLALLHRWNRRREYQNLVRQGYNPFGGGTQGADGRQATQAPPDAQTVEIQGLRGQIAEAVGRRDVAAGAQLYLRLRKLDGRQVMARPMQLDLANELAHEQRYAEAAEAYELLLERYGTFDQVEQVQLMLGLVYARYLGRYAAAAEHLRRALTRLHDERQVSMARAELAHVESLVAAGTGNGAAAVGSGG